MTDNSGREMESDPVHSADERRVDRRSLLKSLAAGTVSGLAGAGTTLPAGTVLGDERPTASSADNPIVIENRRPGTLDWQLTYVRTDRSTKFRCSLIEGYCSQTSVTAGDTLDLFLSANPATDVTVDIYRLGYYQGLGGRFVTRLGPVAVTPQPVPEPGPNRVHECRWAKAHTLTIPPDWVSGVYVGKLSCTAHRYESYVVFIVRDSRPVDVLFQCSDNTWQAYNKWPSTFSLYDSDPQNALNGTTRVSFDRPYGQCPQVVDQPLSQGSGEFLCWEFPCVFWLEREDYNVGYISNVDTHTRPETFSRAKVMLSVGHDEYWSLTMYDNVRQAIANGLSVGFLSGNTCCFVAPLVPSTAGQPSRVFHRAGRYGGLLEAEKGQMGPFDLEGPNENLLIGARTISPFNGSGDWIVTKPDHWLFEGTGLKAGDKFRGLVGWEFHGDPAAIPGLEVVASGTTTNAGDRDALFTSTIYPGPKGNWVFNASTIFWSMGLSQPPGVIQPHSHFGRPHGPDARVGQITANFLAKCGARPGVPRTS